MQRIWIDLDNSPHVHFFAPIIRKIRREGNEVQVTIRAFGQVEELARHYGLQFTVIGEHKTPRNFLTRVSATLARAFKLAAFALKNRPTAAVSHGSRAQAIAAWMLRIPCMTIFDYEFVSSHLFSKTATRILVPQSIPPDRLLAQGIDLKKVVQYPGFKEEVYVYDVPLSPAVLEELQLDPARLIVTVRPPATWAHYHNPHTEVLFRALVERLRQEPNAQVIVLPRTIAQGKELTRKYGMNGEPFRVLIHAVDGLSLMRYSDAVFSGGGTMIREAALLGARSYSIFAGETGAADAALVAAGKLNILRELVEVQSLKLSKRQPPSPHITGRCETRDFIFRQILTFAG